MQPNKPKITVYITNYNYGKYIKKAIESVLTRDSALARLVVATDDKIDLFENEIESLCIQLIALKLSN